MLFIALIVVVGFIGFGGRTYLQHTMRHTHRERVREYIDDENAITPGLQVIAEVSDRTMSSNGTKRFSDRVTTPIDEADRATGVELGTYT